MRKDAESLGQGLTGASLVWKVKEHELSRKLLYNFFFFFSVTAPFYLEDSRRIQDSKRREWRSAWGGRERERERERESTHAHARGRESPRESALAPPFICFFFHLGLPYANWA